MRCLHDTNHQLRWEVEETGEEADDESDDDDENWEDAVEENTGTGVVLGKEWFHWERLKGSKNEEQRMKK